MDKRKMRKRRRLKRRLIAYGARLMALLFVILVVFACGKGIAAIVHFFRKDTVTAGQEMTTGKTEGGHHASGSTIVLDAGHGGKDQGTAYDLIIEKEINLSIVLKLRDLLENQGVNVVLTRDADYFVELEDRAAVANRENADLFVSIHCNSFEKDASIHGLECYYYDEGMAGQSYAEKIYDAIEERGKIRTRAVKNEDFSVLRNAKSPAVLIEIGYLTNEADRKNLMDRKYRDLLVAELAEGILACLGE